MRLSNEQLGLANKIVSRHAPASKVLQCLTDRTSVSRKIRVESAYMIGDSFSGPGRVVGPMDYFIAARASAAILYSGPVQTRDRRISIRGQIEAKKVRVCV